MSSTSGWFDPRLTVFIIWGFFVVLFLCIPSKRLVAKLLRCLGCSCCVPEEDFEVRANNPPQREGVDYEYLSAEKKHEIDCLRSIALLRHLSRFSLTLKEENMVKRISDTHSVSSSECSASECDKKSTTEIVNSTAESCPVVCDIPSEPQGNETESNDIETNDAKNEVDSAERGIASNEIPKETEKVKDLYGEAVGEFTHILVPHPGHDDHCVKVKELNPNDSDESKLSTRRISILPKEKDEKKEVKLGEELKEASGMDGKRDVPIFCAVCLMEYEISERICWSSNPDCTHVFHEDCIVQWLVSLGKTKSKKQSFSDNPPESQLLNYELECPCCRQEFISKVASPDIIGEENV